MAKILITGGGGVLGRGLAAALAGRHDLRLLDIRPLDTVHESVVGDVRNVEVMLDACENVDVLVHTAAWHGGTAHLVSGDVPYWDLNASGTYYAFEAAKERGVKKVVFISSGVVYWGGDVYSLTKIVGEQIGKHYHEIHGLEVIFIRPWDFTLRDYIDHGLRLLGLHVHPKDVVSATARAIEWNAPGLEWFNVDKSFPFSEAQYARFREEPQAVLREVYGARLEILERFGVTLPGRIDVPDCFYHPDLSKTRELLGWQPRFDFGQWLDELHRREEAGEDYRDTKGEDL